MIQKTCGKRTILHTVTRVHHQVTRLVQDHDIVVFVNDVERDIFRFQRASFFFRNLVHHHHHAGFDTEILGGRNTTHLDFSCGNQFLNIRAGHVIHDTDKELVDAFTRMFFFNDIVHYRSFSPFGDHAH